MKNRIGIRREDKNPWEKRIALVPSCIERLVKQHGLEIDVQPSSNRIFSEQDFSQRGAVIKEDLFECKIIIAIKEIPKELIKKNRIYMFFSHTTKGQPQNMPMLKMLKERQCTLIDYEKITDKKGRRLVFFGTQAGQAGMIEVLSALGNKLAIKGFQKNPFISVMQPYQYESLEAAKKEILGVRQDIEKNGIEDAITPLIAGFAGYGHTSHGAQEIFDMLPCEEIKPGELSEFVQGKKYSSHKVYKVVFKEEHMVETREKSSVFDLQDYYNHPEKYRSKFERYLPHMTLLLNCIYWESKYPRFVPNKALKKMFKNVKYPKIQVIGDISCDLKGSIECNSYATTPDNPVFTYDPIQDEIKDGFFENGVAVMSIDNLPAEIPLESSVYFSRALEPFMPKIAKADFSKEFKKCKLPSEIKKAVILFRGEFTPDYKYLEKFITSEL